MISKIVKKVFGTKHDRDIKKIMPLIDEINQFDSEFDSLSDEQIKDKTAEFKKRIEDGETVDDLLPEAFAAVKQACKR